ncbi:LysR substrate-binding domain-containing protein [Pseudaquabacterium rugosum]|uniref:LysR substrate-binding domain-containing protein n=1 Tax=Pseudaquabacterium rugosum TaxID=2984194 RepID=A0ABU9B8L9_9BURK
MRRTLPTTASLTAFETAARRLSFTLAADELAVTQSAVCRQIAALEAALGVKLFRRDGRGVALTEAGAAYARQVRARLDELERDALALMARGGPGGSVGALELGVVPTFATRWLLPRLGGFQAAHPGIQLHLSSRTRPFLFDEARLDAAIHAGTAPWPGTTGRVLLAEQMLPVAAPAWLAAHGFAPDRLPRTAADWQRLVLLQPATRPYAWREWFGAQGLGVAGDMAGPRLELFSMLAEAAGCGLGVALVPPFVVADELARGVLVPVAAAPMPSGRSYFLIYPEHAAEANPVLRTFADWLQAQAGAA